jgi:UDP-glucose 4-epimerase
LRILILGSEGFIGGHCVTHFLAKKYTVFGIDLFEQPSRNYKYTKVSRLSPELDELFEQNPFDAVINAAGSGNVPYSMTHPLIDFEANSLDTIRVLEAIRKHQPTCKYIHISSAAVYGNPVALPVQEDHATVPLSPYGWHKLIGEQLCMEYSSIYSLNLAIVRPFSVYGIGLKKQLFWDVYHKIVDSPTGSIELHGTGFESRDFIQISDLVRVFDLILERGLLKGEVYNLASGEEVSIKEAVETFIETLGRPITYRFNGIVRTGDPLNWKADVTKIQRLGFIPNNNLLIGLAEVSAWLQQLKN